MSAPATSASKAKPYVALAALALLAAVAVLGFARFGDPAIMPPQIRKLAETDFVHNPRAFREIFTPSWTSLCRAWDTWLDEVQANAPRLLQNEALWSGPDDPVRVALAKFSANANDLRPEAIVPAAAGEKQLAVLGVSPSEAVRSELLKYHVATTVDSAWREVMFLARQLRKWPHVEQELPGLAKTTVAVAPR